MNEYKVFNILDMAEAIGEKNLKELLSDFYCEDMPKLLNFYQNEKNGFGLFNERYAASDHVKYIQLFNFF